MRRREVRADPLTGDRVVLSPDRFVERRVRLPDDAGPDACPFCPGHEAHTRPTIDQVPRDGAWAARAFANRFPALVVEERLEAVSEGLFHALAGVGAHEVLVEAPEHAPLHTLPVARTEAALALAVARLRDLRQDERLAQLLWFRNHGVGAGASQAHPHAQIVGLPYVPERTARAIGRARAAWDGSRSLVARVVDGERASPRALFTDGPIAAFCPFAPAAPFEVWLASTRAAGGLADADDDELAGLASAMHRVGRALAVTLGEAPTATHALGPPERAGDPRWLGWHVRVSPRWGMGGALELATGDAMHGVFPEDAAEALRSALAAG